MKEPRQWLQQILADQYAMPSTHERACKLYNNLRRQVERRKRRTERMEAMDQRIAELESVCRLVLESDDRAVRDEVARVLENRNG